MKRGRLSKDEKSTITTRVANGESLEQVAADLGRTVKQVTKFVEESPKDETATT